MKFIPSNHLSLVALSMALVACGENSDNSQFQILPFSAFESIKGAQPVELSPSEKLVISHGSQYLAPMMFLLNTSSAGGDVDALGQEINTQVDTVSAEPQTINRTVSQNYSCYVSGSRTLTMTVNSRVQRPNENQIAVDVSGVDITHQIDACGSPSDQVSGALNLKYRLHVDGQRAFHENQETDLRSSALNWDFAMLSSGTMTYTSSSGAQELELKDFGFAIKLSADDHRELVEASADPMGVAQGRERIREVLLRSIRCKGSLVIAGREVSCGQYIVSQLPRP